MTTSSDSVALPFARHHDLPALDRSALLVVDLQRLFTSPDQPTFIAATRDALPRALLLVDAFRAAARPVAYTRHAHVAPPRGAGMGRWWSRFVIDGTAAAELDPMLSPAEDEPVVRKDHYAALFHTPLEGWLRSKSVDTVVLCGTMTHICVDTTARDAFMRGFDVVVASDACASKNPTLHEAALQGLSHAVARVCTVRVLVDRIEALR